MFTGNHDGLGITGNNITSIIYWIENKFEDKPWWKVGIEYKSKENVIKQFNLLRQLDSREYRIVRQIIDISVIETNENENN